MCFYRLTRRVLFSWPFFCILFHFLFFYFLRDFPDAAAIHLGVNGSGGDDPFFTSTASRLDLEPTTAGPHELSPGKYLLFFFFLLLTISSHISMEAVRLLLEEGALLFDYFSSGRMDMTAARHSLSPFRPTLNGEGRRESLFLVSRGLRAGLVCAPGSNLKKKKGRWEKETEFQKGEW